MKLTSAVVFALLALPVVAENNGGGGTRGHLNRKLEGFSDSETSDDSDGPKDPTSAPSSPPTGNGPEDPPGDPTSAPSSGPTALACPCFDEGDIATANNGQSCLFGRGTTTPKLVVNPNAARSKYSVIRTGSGLGFSCLFPDGGFPISGEVATVCAGILSSSGVPPCATEPPTSAPSSGPTAPTSAPTSGPTMAPTGPTCPCYGTDDVDAQLAKNPDACLETSDSELLFSARGNGNSNFAMLLSGIDGSPTCSYKVNGFLFEALSPEQVLLCEAVLKTAPVCPTPEPTSAPSSAPTGLTSSCPCWDANVRDTYPNGCYRLEKDSSAFTSHYFYPSGNKEISNINIATRLRAQDALINENRNDCQDRNVNSRNPTTGISQEEVVACIDLIKTAPVCP